MIRARRQLSFEKEADPRNTKARQWRAVLSGTKPGNSETETRASQKSEIASSGKISSQ
jgi:hypothetical protein